MRQHWKTYKLGEFATFQRGFDLPSQNRCEGTIPIIAASGITGYHNQYKVKGPGVVTGRSGTIGQVMFSEIDYWPLNTSLWVKDFHENDPKFVYYFFKNFDFGGLNSGTSVPTLNRNDLHELEVTIPPLPEQRAIASILSALDDKIELNLQMNKTLEEIAMALYKHWFMDFGPFKDGKFVESELGLIPEGWEVKSLKMVCNRIYSGGTPNTSIPEFWNGNLKWLSSGETGNKYIIDTEKRISELGVEKSSTRLASKYSIVMASAGQGKTRGQTSLLLTDTFINQSVLCIEPNEKLAHFTLLYFFLAGQYDFLRHISDSSSTRGSLTTGLLGEQLKLALPNVSLQSKFINQTSEFINQIENNLKENEILRSQRDSLLPKLINGEITVKF